MALQPPPQPHGPAAETAAPTCPVRSGPSTIVAVADSTDSAGADAATAATPATTPAATIAPPPDHGRDAYLALAACSLAQAPIWGYSISFGVFQQYYATHSLRTASPAAITSVGTTQTGVMYLAVPVVVAVLTRFPRTRAWCGPLGVVLAVAGLAGSSAAADNVPALISTQGAMYALGCALLFGPASLSLNEWFVARKGFALGVMWAAKSSVGVGMPLLMTALLHRFGLAATLQAWAVATVLLALPGLVVLRKPRVAAGAVDGPAPSSSAADAPAGSSHPLAFLRRPLFWLLMAGNTMQSLGYQIPNSYIASYSTALFGARGAPLGAFTGAFMLALFAVGSIPGAMVMGMLGDRLSASTVVLVSSAGSVASVYGLWYVIGATQTTASAGSAFALLAVFVLVYGFFAGGFSSTWSAVQHAMRRRDPATDTGLVFGLLMGGRGLGFVLSGPVSGSLLKHGTGSSTASSVAATATATAAATATATSHALAFSSAVLSPVVTATASAFASSVATAAAAAASASPSIYVAPVASYRPLIICTGTTATLGACGALWSLGTPCRRLGRRALVLAQRVHEKMRSQ